MCGRYTLHIPPAELVDHFGVTGPVPNLPARYNIAPTQTAPVVRLSSDGSERRLVNLRWGLVPAWGETARSRFDLINARAETVSTTPAFRNAFRSRRCLVPASGFYEWQAEGRHKQPFWFTPEDGAPLALAGLWERWHGDEETIESFAIVTCPANADVAPVHDRMPVILPPEAWRRWLEDPVEDARALMRPAPTGLLRALPVSTRVNRPNIDEPALILQQNSA